MNKKIRPEHVQISGRFPRQDNGGYQPTIKIPLRTPLPDVGSSVQTGGIVAAPTEPDNVPIFVPPNPDMEKINTYIEENGTLIQVIIGSRRDIYLSTCESARKI